VRLTREALSLLQQSPEERQALVESRFALQQALREWPENAQATEAMARCTHALFLLELKDGNLSAAALLLNELKDPPPALRSSLEALRRQRQEEEEAKQRLASIEREQDLKISNTARLRLAFLVVGVNLLVTAYLTSQIYRDGNPLTAERALLISISIEVIALLVFYLGRRHFFSNQINRQISTAILLLTGCLPVHRLMNLSVVRPIEQMFLEEVFFLGVALIVSGIFYRAYLIWIGLASLGMALVSAWYPGYAAVLLGLQLNTPFLGMILEWRKIERS
jgi:hypothetical protein